MTEQNTWDLSLMYADAAQWRQDLTASQNLAEELIAMKGSITKSAANLLAALHINDALGEKISALFVYAKMNFDQNMADKTAKDIYESADSAYTLIMEKLAFFEPELLTMSKNDFERFVQEEPKLALYEFLISELLAKKAHIFDTRTEEILSKLGALGNSFEKIYDDLSVNDIIYPQIKAPNGQMITVDNNNYAVALSNPQRSFRAEYFNTLLNIYGQHINTLTSIYYGSVKNDVFVAKSRQYTSARAMALSGDHVDEAVYDNLISTVRAHTQPLQEYMALRKEKLGLETIHFYDLFVPLVADVDRQYTYEEAQELVLNATAVLGKDYTDVLKEAFANRWIDVYPAKNKATGAYAIDAYGYHPYSLLNFTGTLNDVFTVAHELGHVMHSYYSNQHQPFVYADYSIFTAEVASTVNEQLLFAYLYQHSRSDDEKALLLCNQLDNIRSTLYRQTLFADFEYQTHQLVEQGLPLLPDNLCDIYENLYRIYHGDDFVIDDTLRYEWARIPHFYRAFYVYQYATGVSAAVSIAKGLLSGKPEAVKNYRAFLTKGGSDYPIELLKIAGVDMATPTAIVDTLGEFQVMLKQLNSLLA